MEVQWEGKQEGNNLDQITAMAQFWTHIKSLLQLLQTVSDSQLPPSDHH